MREEALQASRSQLRRVLSRCAESGPDAGGNGEFFIIKSIFLYMVLYI